MEEIVAPIDRAKILSELTEERLLRRTHFGSNLIYSVNYKNAPNIMLEIGRLREIAFREAGGGTGKSVDIDSYDTDPKYAYEQLIIWDPESQEILGGYRYLICKDAKDEEGNYHMATTELFDFTDKFKNEYLPNALELGRSFVHHEYQSGTKGRKGIFVLDNLWEGIGALVKLNPVIKYFFGKVTMYLQYDKLARDYILYFMKKNCFDNHTLMKSPNPLPFHHSEEEIAKVFVGKTIKEDYKILFNKVRELHTNIPPLINSYVNLSDTMKSFDTVLNTHFGDVEETGILVTVKEIVADKLERYVHTYNPITKS